MGFAARCAAQPILQPAMPRRALRARRMSLPSAMTQAVAASQPAPLLRVANVGVRFGGIVALDGVSFDLDTGQMLGLIGPNGAGKTTLFNCFSRLYTPVRGDILFKGASILDKPPHRIAGIGIGRTFQNLAL